MTPQPREYEDPHWDSGSTYGERITGQPSVWPALSRPIWGSPLDADILADWGHADCAICAKAAKSRCVA